MGDDVIVGVEGGLILCVLILGLVGCVDFFDGDIYVVDLSGCNFLVECGVLFVKDDGDIGNCCFNYFV